MTTRTTITYNDGATEEVVGDFPMVRDGVLHVFDPRTRVQKSWPLASIRTYSQVQAH